MTRHSRSRSSRCLPATRPRGLARIQSAVVVIAPDTGQILALLDGAALTALRTAAASAVATDLLARRERGRSPFWEPVFRPAHVEAICAVRPIETVRVYSPTPAKVAALCQAFSRHPSIRAKFMAASSPADALGDADIVCATTTSRLPVFRDVELKPGVHLNAVGSFTPEAAEVPAETVARARVVVDSREAAWLEAGDLIQPLRTGLIGRDHIHAELGELVLGRKTGRVDDVEVTFFKSVGIAVQDAVAGRWAVANGAHRRSARRSTGPQTRDSGTESLMRGARP